MAANINPSFTGSANNGLLHLLLVTGDGASYDGTGANAKIIFIADATNGSFFERVDVTPAGTNGTASVMRFWRNNGSSVGSASNNNFIGELSLPATTASQAAALVQQVKAFGFWLEPGFRIIAGLGNSGSAGWYAQAYGGNY